MRQIARLNICIGFSVVTVAAAAGSFIAHDLTESFLRDKSYLNSWQMTLLQSAHGHTNMFGLLHIAYGLTSGYSLSSNRRRLFETMGLFCGTFAMAVLMLLRSYGGPTENLDLLEILTGVLLSCALAALASHSFGLAEALYRRVPEPETK